MRITVLLALFVLALASTGAAQTLFGIEQLISDDISGPIEMDFADIDGDGDLDLVTASTGDDTIAWFPFQSGSFGPRQIISASVVDARRVIAADMDADGDVDVVVASSLTNRIVWFENVGSGTFGPEQLITNTAYLVYGIDVADMDGDGDLDVLSASPSFDRIEWHRNEPGGFGATILVTDQANIASAVKATDIDGDGDLDVIWGAAGTDTVAWQENLSFGLNFGPAQIIATDYEVAEDLEVADLDGDGDADLVVASSEDDSFSWHEKVGNGFGARQVIDAASDGANTVHVVDLDEDGDLDLLTSALFGDTVAWFENLGPGFGPKQVIANDVAFAISVVAFDLDGDGDPEVIAASRTGNEIVAFENLTPSTTIRVPQDQLTIQAGLDAANTGDTVLVAPGIYFESIDFAGKDVSLVSEAGPEATVIDGSGIETVVLFPHGSDYALLEGFTIRNGFASSEGPGFVNFGGGILCFNASPTIRDCRITACTAVTDGGGISIHSGSPTVIGCTFDACTAGQGGGGIRANGIGHVRFFNCLVHDNAAPEGAGIWLRGGGTTTLVNCTVTRNVSSTMSGGVARGTTGIVNFVNGITWGNTPLDLTSAGPGGQLSVEFSLVPAGTPGLGNVHGDPLFADAVVDDFRLTFASPARDAGTTAVTGLPATDIDGDPRVVGTHVDMGADEFTAPPITYPGSGSDLRLFTGINGPVTPIPDLKTASAGDALFVRLQSPSSTYDFGIPVIAAQLFVTANGPRQPGGFPEVWLNPSPAEAFPAIALYDGNQVPFGPAALSPGGLELGFTIPILPPATSVMIQGFALAPSAETGNPIFTATDGHEIVVE